jgi:hypothetical protein
MSAEKETRPSMKFADPYEILGPCRSRVIAGAVMIAVLAGLIFVLSG